MEIAVGCKETLLYHCTRPFSHACSVASTCIRIAGNIMNSSAPYIVTITAAILLTLGGMLHAQPALTVLDFNSTAFPNMTAKLLAIDTSGKPARGLRPEDISIVENGIARTVTRITCPEDKSPEPLSIGLMVDSYRYTDILSQGIRRMAAFLQMPPVEAGITTMDRGVYIVQDFTTRKNRLIDATSRLISSPGVHLQRIFYEANTGGVPFITGRQPRKILVLLTDLHCPVFDLDTNRFWKDAERENIAVYTLLLHANDYFGLFKRLSDKTGGKLYERVKSVEEIESILEGIVTREQNLACEVEWQSEYDCLPIRFTHLSVFEGRATADGIYQLPAESIPTLSIAPSTIGFIGGELGIAQDTTIVLTANYNAVTIDSITTDNSAFTIVSSSVPQGFVLQPGESRSIQIRYIPTNYEYRFCRFSIHGNMCKGSLFYASGEFPGEIPVHDRPTLNVVYPNGGEKLVVGDTVIIRWSGILPEDPVNIYYSIDSGVSWISVADSVTDLQYKWIVPNTLSNNCLMKVEKVPIKTVMIDLPGYPVERKLYAWSSEFSPDGRYVIIAGSDDTARVWDVHAGVLVHKLVTGDQHWMRTAMYSRDGKRIVTGSRNAVIKIWDAKTGALLQKIITGHTFSWPTQANLEPGGLDFSPDGNQIVTGGEDSVKIWDVATGLLVASFYPGNRTHSVRFTATGQELVVGCGDGAPGLGSLTLWNCSPPRLIRTFVGQVAGVNSCSINNFGNRIASLDGRNIRIWDTQSGALLNTLLNSGRTTVRFDPTGKYVISELGGFALICDIVSGELVRKIPEFSTVGQGVLYNVITTANYSPNGRRIVTTDESGHARIWNFGVGQQDTSDSLWAIIAPDLEVAASEIDMGQVLLHRSKDSLVRAVLCNRGTTPAHVLGVDVRGGNIADFVIMSGAGDFTLAPGECRDIVFTFMPMGLGPRDAWVTVRTTSDWLENAIHIFGEGVEPVLQVLSAPIDFGIIEVGDRKDTTVTVVLKNTGPVPINFSNARQIGPDTAQFAINAGDGVFMLAPGEEHSMNLSFTPTFIGRTNGRIAFSHEGVGSPAIITLYGQGIGGEIYVPNDSAAAGEIFDLPVMLNGPRRFVERIEGGVARFSTQLRFDASLLTAQDPSLHGPIAEGFQTMNITGAWDAASDTLVAIPMIVGLGGAERTDVEVVSFTWLDDNGNPLLLDADTRNGRFQLTGLCREGGTRLINAEGTIALKPVRPLPARDLIEIEYEVTESGRTHLSIIDMFGRSVATVIDGVVDPGRYTTLVDISNLSTGLYRCVLQTPTMHLSQGMEVVK
jgi:WD40 repeat protein